MGVFVGRDGNISIFRVSIIAVIVGAIFIVGGFVLFSLEQSFNSQPLEVTLPEGAVFKVTETLSGNARRLYYESAQEANEIARFYDQQMLTFYGENSADRQSCVRTPASGNYSNYVEGNGTVPFEYRCLFSITSLAGSERYTEVLIQPGVRNDAAGTNYVGITRIEHFQSW
jgi:hypothetical protein